jgi:hypothetical protein
VAASTVSIHDGDYWRHVLLHDGAVVDRFASMPGYFTDDPAETERLRVRYRGDAEVIAGTVGCRAEQVAPYLVHVDLGDDDQGFEVVEPELGRAFPDDQFERDDPGVFIDFWRRFGPLLPGRRDLGSGQNPPGTGLDEPHPRGRRGALMRSMNTSLCNSPVGFAGFAGMFES